MTRIAILAFGCMLFVFAVRRHEVPAAPPPACGVAAGHDGCRP